MGLELSLRKRRVMMLWLQFAVVAAVIVYAGSNLSKYGDVIAEKTELGRTWVGVVLIASVTSLPELITGISSIAIFDLPNIAVGNVLAPACSIFLLWLCSMSCSVRLP